MQLCSVHNCGNEQTVATGLKEVLLRVLPLPVGSKTVVCPDMFMNRDCTLLILQDSLQLVRAQCTILSCNSEGERHLREHNSY